jgi:protein-tyrosine-phosphatase
VPDPWGGDDAEFDRALALIERSCRGLVAELARARR